MGRDQCRLVLLSRQASFGFGEALDDLIGPPRGDTLDLQRLDRSFHQYHQAIARVVEPVGVLLDIGCRLLGLYGRVAKIDQDLGRLSGFSLERQPMAELLEVGRDFADRVDAGRTKEERDLRSYSAAR